MEAAANFFKSQTTALVNGPQPTDLDRRDYGCPALIAQSARLLGQVLRLVSNHRCFERDVEVHHSKDGWSPHKQQEGESAQLSRTLTSLIDAAESEARRWAVPIENQLTICYR